MTSSLEAFAKLRNWKKRNTVLKVTVVESGIPCQRVVQIFGVDEDLFVIGVMLRGSRVHFELDLDGANFKIGDCALEAERGQNDFIAFEELKIGSD